MTRWGLLLLVTGPLGNDGLWLPLATTDHHEFDAIEQKGRFRFLWLR